MLSHRDHRLALKLWRKNFENLVHQLGAPFHSRLDLALRHGEILVEASTFEDKEGCWRYSFQRQAHSMRDSVSCRSSATSVCRPQSNTRRLPRLSLAIPLE